jgi:hypothetical protein
MSMTELRLEVISSRQRINDLLEEIERQTALSDKAIKRNGELSDLLDSVKQWCRAYPLALFPEPDWGKVDEVCTNAGISLTAIAGANMRHVVDGIQRIITEWEENSTNR